MKFLATADLHFDEISQVPALASITTLVETTEREKPTLVTISGDLFNRAVKNTAASGFVTLLGLIKRILDICPVAAVSGTPTHDLQGCYEALVALQGRHSFVMLDPSRPLLLCDVSTIEEGMKASVLSYVDDLTVHDTPTLLVLGCPEPTREWLLAGSEGQGAQEAAEAMKTALRGILLGLGAVRAQHPEIPCVMLFHGPVEGASMQNGQIIGAGSITIGREDLALVGADYYALGDIHLAQQISGMPAYYPGSAYPVNWGELGVSGFNLVEIQHDDERTRIEESERFNATVTRIPFPHPRRMKFVVPASEPIIEESIKGLQVWVVLRGTREELENQPFDEETLEMMGAIEGSRVTQELIPTETVRAAEITEKHRLAEKLDIYAEASGEDPTLIKESVIAKADQLEREAAERGAAAGMHFRLRRLRLRGAVGIWKGLRRDEIDINLDQKDPGLIALIGVNGAGKSTLIENMHPYPCMLTRDGKLQDHFRLRDSARELWFVDERTSTEYRALMEIDGANSSGAVKYHLFRQDAEGMDDLWTPLTNGRKEDYEAAIEHLIGSLPLFLRSAFVSQRPTKSNPDLSEATKGEKKAIFRELAGLDYIQAYAESAKQKAAAIEAELAVERGRITLLESQLETLPGIRNDRDFKVADLELRNLVLQKLAAAGSTLKAEAEQLAQKVKEQETLAQRIAGLEDQLAQQRQIVALAQQSIGGYRAALEGKPGAEKVITNYEDLEEQENAENGRLSALNADNARLQGEYNARLTAHHADVRKLEASRGALKEKSATLAGDRNVLQAQIDHLSVELKVPLKDTCPTCRQILPAEMLAELTRKRTEIVQKVKDLTEKKAEAGQQIAVIDGEVAAITLPPNPTPPELPECDQAAIKRIQDAIAALNIVLARKTLATAQEAATRLEEAKKRQTEAEAQVTRLSGEIFAAQSEQDATVAYAYDQAQTKLEEARREYGEAAKAVAALEAQIQGLDARIAELEASQADLCARKAKVEAQQGEAGEWRYLCQATGPDGIQALELDALGPGIAETANRILSAAYGNRFALEFRTTRMGGKGSKAHQIEDFQIWVIDSELGTEQEISTLSGGETVWIKNALYAAFGIIRERSTGIKFLTCFLDEMDGALDPEARQKYFDMLQAVHQESGRRHTLIITHSESAQEMIAQRIIMSRATEEAHAI